MDDEYIALLKSQIRQLLEEQFGFSAHVEQREMPVFELTVRSENIGLVEAGTDESPSWKTVPRQPRQPYGRYLDNSLTAFPMNRFLSSISSRLDRPIIDKTGLAGKYNFEIILLAKEDHSPALDRVALTQEFYNLGFDLEETIADVDVMVVDNLELPPGLTFNN